MDSVGPVEHHRCRDAAASSRGVEERWFGAYVAGAMVAWNFVTLDMSEAGDGGAW
jgi:hypothetical protein